MPVFKICHNTCTTENCKLCWSEISKRVYKYANTLKTLKIESLSEKLYEWYNIDKEDLQCVIQTLCTGKVAITEGNTILSLPQKLHCDIFAASCPVVLKNWAKENNVCARALLHEMQYQNTQTIYLYKNSKNEWEGKPKTGLCAHDQKSLEKALKKRRFSGTLLAEIFAEYEMAYKDLFLSKNIFVTNNLAWHVSAAAAQQLQ